MSADTRSGSKDGSKEQPQSPPELPSKLTHLESFKSIRSPSYNHDTNRQTFAYRLSEGVFGSLLASYVLGFMGFAALYPAPAVEKFPLNSFLKTLATANFAMIFQVLMVSVLFSAYTALLYVNYHQSILYLSQNQRKSYLDFLLAITIGFFFGLSMTFPLSTMLWIGLLTICVFARRRALISDYAEYVAERIATEAQVTFNAGTGLGDDKEHRAKVIRGIISDVKKALDNSNNPIIKSWVGKTLFVWVAVWIMVLIPAVAFLVEFFYIVAWGLQSSAADKPKDAFAFEFKVVMVLLILNICYCAATSALLLWRLRATSADMPSHQENGDVNLDQTLDALLLPIKDRLQKEETAKVRSLGRRQ